jgi:hypothetical protein
MKFFLTSIIHLVNTIFWYLNKMNNNHVLYDVFHNKGNQSPWGHPYTQVIGTLFISDEDNFTFQFSDRTALSEFLSWYKARFTRHSKSHRCQLRRQNWGNMYCHMNAWINEVYINYCAYIYKSICYTSVNPF